MGPSRLLYSEWKLTKGTLMTPLLALFPSTRNELITVPSILWSYTIRKIGIKSKKLFYTMAYLQFLCVG